MTWNVVMDMCRFDLSRFRCEGDIFHELMQTLWARPFFMPVTLAVFTCRWNNGETNTAEGDAS